MAALGQSSMGLSRRRVFKSFNALTSATGLALTLLSSTVPSMARGSLLACSSPDLASSIIDLNLEMRLKQLAAAGKVGSHEDVSDVIRPFFPTGIGRTQIASTLCLIGMPGLSRFKGSTAPGEIAYVARRKLAASNTLSLVVKIVVVVGMSGERLARSYAYLETPASS